WNRTCASEKRGCVQILASVCDGLIEESLHPAILREVRVDELRGLARIRTQLLGQPECGQPVNNSEVDYLRDAPVLLRLRHRANTKNFLSCPRVNIFLVAERVGQ